MVDPLSAQRTAQEIVESRRQTVPSMVDLLSALLAVLVLESRSHAVPSTVDLNSALLAVLVLERRK